MANSKVPPDMPKFEGGLIPGAPLAQQLNNGRPSMRQEDIDSLERARLRTAQVRDLLGDAGLDDGTDEFYIDPSVIPAGWCYEWKMISVLGKEDPAYSVALRRKGWEPVPAIRHPEMMPLGERDGPITRKGVMLMERPQELTDEARRIEKFRALSQVRGKEEQLNSAPPGTFDRANKGASMTKLGKSYTPMPVPGDTQ